MARTTVAQASTRIDALEARFDRLEALIVGLSAQEPAKAPAKKTTRAKKATKPATKGAQTRETLSRKDWNRTLTAKARLAGKYENGESVYSWVLANWDEAQVAREAGMTPDEFLAGF